MRYAVIMAGGSGTRLWPLSRQGTPKQLLPLIDQKSLLRLAFERVATLLPAERIWVCASAAYADEIIRQLPEVPAGNVLGEPVGRDSLNAVAWPAAVLAAQDPQAVVAMLTADQIIAPVDVFAEDLDEAFRIAEADPSALVTFGVLPTSPHTGYGYLERGTDLPGFPHAAHVLAFHEKPDSATAERYLASGRYWWNAGMFVWRAATLLDQLHTLLPRTYDAVVELAEHPERLAEIYPGLFKSSVDYAVMEPVARGQGSAHVVAVGLDVEWMDVGSFAALHEVLSTHGWADELGNVCQGQVVQLDAQGNLLLNNADDVTVLAVIGLHDMVVVRTAAATLVAPLAASERVKQVVEQVAETIDPALA